MSNNKSIINWLNQLTEDGKTVTMRWDGGNDSGWVYFEVDGEQIDNEYSEALVEHMYTTLDYGSWAGEFSASGEAEYKPETQTFEGTDYYSEDDWETVEANIVIQVPKELWFETLHIECECSADDDPQVSVRFIVKNGFLTDQHTDFCTNLENILGPEFNDLFDQYNKDDNFRGCSDSWIIERSEMQEEEDGLLVYNIDKVEIQTMQSQDKDICLELDEETIESIDNKLNSNDED